MELMTLKRRITYLISFLFPKKKNRWTFGAWMGGRFSDNPKAYLKYMLDHHPEYEYYWICNDPESIDKSGFEKVTFFKRDTFDGWKTVVTSDYLVMGHGARDFSEYNWNGGSKGIFFDHGTPYKLYGIDGVKVKGNGLIPKIRAEITKRAIKLEHKGDYYVASSEIFAEIMTRTYDTGRAKVIRAGLPRNEIFFDKEKRQKIKKEILSSLGKDDGTKIIVYLPTFRDSGKKCFSFFDDTNKWETGLKNSIIIEKNHYADVNKISGAGSETVFSGIDFDTQDLIAAADLCITDYSSCFFDFLVADIPAMLFPFDYEYYANEDRGLYFTVEELDCGHNVYNVSELFTQLLDFDQNQWIITEKQQKVREKYVTYECPNNSSIIDQGISER